MDENKFEADSYADKEDNNSAEPDEIFDSSKVDSPSLTEQEVNKQLYSENESNEKEDELKTVENGIYENGSNQISVKKEKRKVYFPGDDNIVKSYLEPPDPWKNGDYFLN